MFPYNVSLYMPILYEVMYYFRVFQSEFFWINWLIYNGISEVSNRIFCLSGFVLENDFR